MGFRWWHDQGAHKSDTSLLLLLGPLLPFLFLLTTLLHISPRRLQRTNDCIYTKCTYKQICKYEYFEHYRQYMIMIISQKW